MKVVAGRFHQIEQNSTHFYGCENEREGENIIETTNPAGFVIYMTLLQALQFWCEFRFLLFLSTLLSIGRDSWILILIHGRNHEYQRSLIWTILYYYLQLRWHYYMSCILRPINIWIRIMMIDWSIRFSNFEEFFTVHWEIEREWDILRSATEFYSTP